MILDSPFLLNLDLNVKMVDLISKSIKPVVSRPVDSIVSNGRRGDERRDCRDPTQA